jgi:hypothetical protein
MLVMRWTLSLLAALLLAWPAVVHADDAKARCVQGHVEGQRSRNAGDLLTARDKLRMCAHQSCPDLVRGDCVAWLREVEGQIPTLVFGARDPAGGDLTEVRVFVDGRQVQKRLAGTPVEVAAGEHLIRFEAANRLPVETKVIVALGEKDRLVRATLRPDSEPPADPVRVLPWVVGGFGLAMATAGLVLDLVGTAELKGLRDECAPFCSSNDVDSTRNKIIVGDTLLIAGLVTAGAAVLWLVLRDPEPSETARRALTIAW